MEESINLHMLLLDLQDSESRNKSRYSEEFFIDAQESRSETENPNLNLKNGIPHTLKYSCSSYG